jgi:Tol biopolymer transport system component
VLPERGAPAWTPDGQEIVFEELIPGSATGDPRWGIARLNAETGAGPPPNPYVAAKSAHRPAISPVTIPVKDPPDQESWEARFYAVGGRDGGIHVITVGALRYPGTGRDWFSPSMRVEQGPNQGFSAPKWSPDGTQLVFFDSTGGDIYTARLDLPVAQPANGYPVVLKAKQLTDDAKFRDRFPDWSPDGHYIVFQRSKEDGPEELWIMKADGTQQRSTLRVGRNPDWAFIQDPAGP